MKFFTKTEPTVAEYKRALEMVRQHVPEAYIDMLKAHYQQRDQALIPSEIAAAAGYKGVAPANLHYGKLGKRVCEALEAYDPPRRGHDRSPQWTMVIANGHENAGKHGGWLWTLRRRVSDALDELGWFERTDQDITLLTDLETFDADPASRELDQTTRKTIRDSRIGQGQFRKDLITHWGGCAVTGCTVSQMLRASHIKPWRDSTNAERLDLFNGLLLQPNLDVAFDACLISFDETGRIMISPGLKDNDLKLLGINKTMKLRWVRDKHQPYLADHRRRFNQRLKSTKPD